MAANQSSPEVLGRVVGVFVGGPKTLHDANGAWRSSIAREAVLGPVPVETRGLARDRATQPFHGDLDSALCLHALAHYQYWNEHHGLHLAPGGVGENLTLDGADESNVCVGDIFQVGSAQLQISEPRTPCETQARRVGRADWVALTLAAMRTGMYARVLTPGSLQTGDVLVLLARPNPGLTMQDMVRCYFHDFEPELAERLIRAEGMADRWVRRFERRLKPETEQE